MSDFNVGDKVYLECEVKEKDMSDNTYKLNYTACYGSEFTYIKDDILHTPDDDYNKGLNDAWELAKKIILPTVRDGYTADEIRNIFGKNSFVPVFANFTPQEALAKVKAYEDERNEIRAGDVVRFNKIGCKAIVTRITETYMCRLFKNGDCGTFLFKDRSDDDYVKTGEHFDSIDEFMKQED